MITDIRLQHFRSYSDETFEFTPGVNIIVGPNASGKTNLLEAILVVAQGKSYRVKDNELIAYDHPWARLDAHGDGMPRTVKLLGQPNPGKTYDLGGKLFKRLSLARKLPTVMFEPNHLLMFGGGPELRRSYLDDLLEQLDGGYAELRRDYKRVLAQRNALLKRQREQSSLRLSQQMFPWNLRLSQLGGRIVGGRLGLLERINQTAGELYGSLAGKPSAVSLMYDSRQSIDSYESVLLKTLETTLQLDIARGFTGNGPHREDVQMYINNRPVQTSASRGETRTAVLMLKVMELLLVEEARGKRPLLLLDDVFSELDGKRRQALTGYLQNYQTFITTTDADVVVEHFMDRCTIIPLG